MHLNPRWFFSYGLLITIACVLTSYFYLDIPVVNWAHAHNLRQYTWLHTVQLLPKAFPAVAFMSLIVIGIRACWARITAVETAVVCTAMSYILSHFLTKICKIIFARTWPETWVDNNVSWLTNGVYKFFWFKDGSAYQSFPSGHTSAMFAVCTMLCLFYPRLRGISLVACTLVIVGLIGNYYHFLSDIIAGAYLGIASALLAQSFRNIEKR